MSSSSPIPICSTTGSGRRAAISSAGASSMPFANNGDFVANAIEVLAGGEDLIGSAQPRHLGAAVHGRRGDPARRRRALRRRAARAAREAQGDPGRNCANLTGKASRATRQTSRPSRPRRSTSSAPTWSRPASNCAMCRPRCASDIERLKAILEFFDIALCRSSSRSPPSCSACCACAAAIAADPARHWRRERGCMQQRGFIVLLARRSLSWPPPLSCSPPATAPRARRPRVSARSPASPASSAISPGSVCRAARPRSISRRSTDSWAVVEKGNYPAAQGKMRQLLLGLADLTLVEPKTERPELFARLDLDDPANGKATDLKLQRPHRRDRRRTDRRQAPRRPARRRATMPSISASPA